MNPPYHIDPRDPKCRLSELQIQSSFRTLMQSIAPAVMLVAVPNEGKRSRSEGGKRKREGMMAGFPDLIAIWNGGIAFLEFKSGKGVLSKSQQDCLDRLVARNHVVGVFRSRESAVDWLRGHGAPFTGRLT